jgi:hypothetical protein
VEFTTQEGGQPRLLRYVGASSDSTPMLMGELRRASTRTGGGPGGGRELFIWNDSGADESQIQSIGKSLELGMRDGRLDDLGVSAAPGVMNGRDFATSISLAVLGIIPAAGAADFLDSRLAPPPEKRVDKRTVAAVAVVLVIVILSGLWYWSLQKRQAVVDQVVKTNKDWDQERAKAQATVKKIQLAQHWHGEKPKFVACLTDLTEVAPQTADIWGTVFTLKDEATDSSAGGAGQGSRGGAAAKSNAMAGQLKGKATNEAVIYALVKKMKDSKKFENVKIGSTVLNDTRGGHETSFDIDFSYMPK